MAPSRRGNVVSWSRPIDIWFSTQVLPHEAHFLRQGRRWSRNSEEAFDLVQEAYLKLLQMDDWPAIRDPRSYTVTMIRNLVLQRVRRDRVVAITDIPAPTLAEVRDDAPGVFETVAAREALLGLLADVNRLPPVCQRVIRMRKFEDRTPTEIAHALGIGISTVETHLARGMQQLTRWRRAAQPSVPFGEAAAPDDVAREEKRA
ncbi:MAG: RNA polymerase subunit sigma-24 [Sphingopyxis sp.]|nr:RNA polymerase subunit sigma-24 [Sphingopyxis sp.]